MVRTRAFAGGSIALLAGVLIGFGIARAPSASISASSDRWGERVVMSGPVAIDQGPTGAQGTRDAIYYLNYSQGLLLAMIPSEKKTAQGSQVLGDFAERDLVRDFQLSPGARPHFLMTIGNLGARSEAVAPVFVFETESGQVAAYRLVPQVTAAGSRPSFQLLERRTDPKLGRGGDPAREN